MAVEAITSDADEKIKKIKNQTGGVNEVSGEVETRRVIAAPVGNREERKCSMKSRSSSFISD